eukprot:scaffold202795_cov53-Prasinocladus_malaysianus.AAC.2
MLSFGLSIWPDGVYKFPCSFSLLLSLLSGLCMIATLTAPPVFAAAQTLKQKADNLDIEADRIDRIEQEKLDHDEEARQARIEKVCIEAPPQMHASAARHGILSSSHCVSLINLVNWAFQDLENNNYEDYGDREDNNMPYEDEDYDYASKPSAKQPLSVRSSLLSACPIFPCLFVASVTTSQVMPNDSYVLSVNAESAWCHFLAFANNSPPLLLNFLCNDVCSTRPWSIASRLCCTPSTRQRSKQRGASPRPKHWLPR